MENDQGMKGKIYKPWKETPSEAWFVESIRLGLACAGLNSNLSAGIEKALIFEGNYYTSGDDSYLLVIPEAGLLVYSYFD